MSGDSEDVASKIEQLNLVSFRKIDEVKKLAHHLNYVLSHPITQKSRPLINYLKRLSDYHKRTCLARKEYVEIDYMFCPEGHKEQRQRWNSLTVNDTAEILKINEWVPENSIHEHLCVQCNALIAVNDEEPLMESLQKHFSLDVHRAKIDADVCEALPNVSRRKSSLDVSDPIVLPHLLRRRSAFEPSESSFSRRKSAFVDVSEPVILPSMSRRMSAMETSKTMTQAMLDKLQRMAPLDLQKEVQYEKVFAGKLKTYLAKNMADNSLNDVLNIYQTSLDSLSNEIAKIDLTLLKHTVAPIIMSIKDNVNQNFVSDEAKNFENDENEKQDKQEKNQVKKLRYYGGIENAIVKLLLDHKMVSLVDERTGKLAFFCVCCEYYSLRFKYDSVLNHVFGESHIKNLAEILTNDIQIKGDHRCVETINDMNYNFLKYNYIVKSDSQYECGLCDTKMENPDACLVHIIDDNHLGRLSDELFKSNSNDVPSEWGQKSLDWVKYLGTTNKSHNFKDYLLVENFIRPSGKFANYCKGCEMTLKGPRQMLFSHVRQKKHLRIAAPHKLQMLYKNYCRPVEYYGSFGNYYACNLCQNSPTPSFGSIVDHIDSELHLQNVAKYLMLSQLSETDDSKPFDIQFITIVPQIKCVLCDVEFDNIFEAVSHILGSLEHGNMLTEKLYRARKYDIIEVYMKDRLILHSEGMNFNCVKCGVTVDSLRALLMHLVFADHILDKLQSESVFRFYLELKYNVNMMIRNKYSLLEFGKIKCGVCDTFLEENDNVKKHVTLSSHREKIGGTAENLNDSQDGQGNE